jgi:hypothetical protein
VSSALSVPGAIVGGKAPFRAGVEEANYTATVGTGQAATGGLMLEAMTGDRIVRTAQDGSVVCVGYATHDAAAGAIVTVAVTGVWPCTASGSIAAGQRVECAAAGKVKQVVAVDNTSAATVATAVSNTRGVVGIAENDATDGTEVRVRLVGLS